MNRPRVTDARLKLAAIGGNRRKQAKTQKNRLRPFPKARVGGLKNLSRLHPASLNRVGQEPGRVEGQNRERAARDGFGDIGGTG